MKNPKGNYDLSFGNSVAVRQAFSDSVTTFNPPVIFSDLMKMDYPVHEGDPELVHMTKQIIFRQMGNIYKHVFITNGATGADVIALRTYSQKGHKTCITRPAPYYGRFPGMINAANMVHVKKPIDPKYKDPVLLMDLPANPTGSFRDGIGFHVGPIVLDAVYLNNVYCGRTPRTEYVHDVLTGSFSKLLGINGIRLGWLATNDDILAERIKGLITGEYCGLSVPSMNILKFYLKDLNWEGFELRANANLDRNRDEMSRLEKYFGNQPVPKVGMFYYVPMDKTCQNLMTKSRLIWTKGSTMGTTDDFGRINVGQDVQLTRDFVQNVLKNDKI